MIDVETLKCARDLAAVVEASLGAPRKASGHRLYWLCPWHDDHHPSLEVNTRQQRWYCPPCRLSGDVISWIMKWDGVDFTEACRRLGSGPEDDRPHRPASAPAVSPVAAGPPDQQWQQRARSFVAYAQEQLWSARGAAGLSYLRQERGLTDDTIRCWSLGWNPRAWRDEPQRWGLGRSRICLSVGVVIPCEAQGALWYVKIRRFGPDSRPLSAPGQKYGGPRGGRATLYGLEARQARKIAVICEGELDALLLWQESGKVGRPLDVLSVGGAGRRLDGRAVDYLAQYARLVVAFDLDTAGQEANARWLGQSDRVRKAVIPRLSDRAKYDLTDFWRDGGRLHDWADYHAVRFYELEQVPSPPPKKEEASEELSAAGDCITMVWPPGAQIATIEGYWRRLDGGEIEATYTREQLELCVAITHGPMADVNQLIRRFGKQGVAPIDSEAGTIS